MTMPPRFFYKSTLIWMLSLCVSLPGFAAERIRFQTQTRDQTTGHIVKSEETIDPKKIGVVVIDMWNWHWCKTSTARVGALVPRMNSALEALRKAGAQVFLCPTDVADNYVGYPQYEKVLNYQRASLPKAASVQCPPAPDGGGCTCGRERCRGNYGWDGMAPDLVIGQDDWIPNDPELLYAICKERGLTHLIYMGVHTQVCLLGKSVGVKAMLEAGFKCMLARDLTDAHGMYDPEKGITPDDFTQKVVEHFEKFLLPTINLKETLEQAQLWTAAGPVDPVRITPWGKQSRPHFFEAPITVTLSAPWEPNAKIYYTLDGSAPTAQSKVYEKPFPISVTTRLRAVALETGKPVTLESEGFFAKLEAMPPKPDVYLSDLKPTRAVGMGHSPSFQSHRFSPFINPPQMDLSNRKEPLIARGEKFAKGIGVHAPNQLLFEIKPGYQRFVGRAGVDEAILAQNSGSNLAMHPSVIFKVFIDGKLKAESPLMRISEPPWRFTIEIPEGSTLLSLATTDGGDGFWEDYANWLEAGFTTGK